MMKRLKVVSILAAAILISATACEKDSQNENNSPAGTYIGTFTHGDENISGKTTSDEPSEAIADEVRLIDGRQMQVHWTGHGTDTTMVLNYYAHQDSVMVCLTGDAFENQYGHMLGEGHMEGGHMNDMHDGETEWIHHMTDEHVQGDEHFGGFDMHDHTFSYRFEVMNNDTSVILFFQGEKSK